MPTYPASYSLRLHSRLRSTSNRPSVGARSTQSAGRLLVSQSRSSVRNDASSGVSRKSTGRPLSWNRTTFGPGYDPSPGSVLGGRRPPTRRIGVGGRDLCRADPERPTGDAAGVATVREALGDVGDLAQQALLERRRDEPELQEVVVGHEQLVLG